MSANRLFVGVAGVALLVVGCEPKVGDSCQRGDAYCLDPQTQLVCEAGRLIATPCRGPKGCTVYEEALVCDISKNQPKDRCSRDEEGAAACSAPDRLIVCRSGQYREEPCRGPEGCDDSTGRARCDRSRSKIGDPCTRAGEKACSIDGNALLECRDRSMQVLYACRGPKRCQVGDQLDCDMTVAEPQDGCSEKMEGALACSSDRSAVLKCEKGQFKIEMPCKSGKRGASQRCVLEPRVRCASAAG